jgi:hypothetical protein
MLFARLFLFAGIQAIFALIFYISKVPNAWETSANWWPLIVGLSNIICLYLLINYFKADGKNYWNLFSIVRPTIKQDLLNMLRLLALIVPIAFLPNILLGKWLFGDSLTSLNMIVRPLPYWAAIISILLFPFTQGLVEIATYFSFVMPQFEKQGMRPWLALGLPVLLLSLQHIAVPLLFNFHFILWRSLMFLPFALLLGIIMRWRPRLLPYLAILHILMDISLPIMFLGVAY